MRSFVFTVFVVLAAAFVVAIGCTTAVPSQSAGNDNGTTNIVTDGGFSDAPTSPGGTGGVVDEPIDAESEETQSFFKAFQIDPVSEDTAGPKFVVPADVDRDGRLDLVTAWNESQPVQLHLQRTADNGSITFRTITLAGTAPVAIVAGVELGHINDDDWLDVVVLIKSTGASTFCPKSNVTCQTVADCSPPCETDDDCAPGVTCGTVVEGACDDFSVGCGNRAPGLCDNYDRVAADPLGVMSGYIMVLYNPGSADALQDGDNWSEMLIDMSNRYPGNDAAPFDESGKRPEQSGYVSLAVGEVDGAPGDDIVTAFNAAECENLGQLPAINTVELWANPGPAIAEEESNWIFATIDADLPQVKDVELTDVDDDGDLDMVATWTNSTSRNIRWYRNPLIPNLAGEPGGTAEALDGSKWESRPIGRIATGADVMAIGDVDGDGFEDVVVRSTSGQLVQWFRRPTGDDSEPVFPPPDPNPDRTDFPWQVYTLTEFDNSEPEAIAIGDVTGDGQVEVIVAANGAVIWFDGTVGPSIFDPWIGNTLVRDIGVDNSDPTGTGSTENDVSTIINDLLVVDLDGDGKQDILGTLDRQAASGLSNDRIVWYLNVRTEEDGE